jgi:hypothetical protein
MTVISFYGCGQDLTPSVFANMCPAHRTLAVLLMQERAYADRVIESATGLSRQEVCAMAARRHDISLPQDDRMVDDAFQAISARHDIPVNAARALIFFRDSGGQMQISQLSLEEQAGLGFGSARNALTWLIERGYLLLGSDPRPKTACSYRLTKTGQRLADQIAAQVAA